MNSEKGPQTTVTTALAEPKRNVAVLSTRSRHGSCRHQSLLSLVPEPRTFWCSRLASWPTSGCRDDITKPVSVHVRACRPHRRYRSLSELAVGHVRWSGYVQGVFAGPPRGSSSSSQGQELSSRGCGYRAWVAQQCPTPLSFITLSFVTCLGACFSPRTLHTLHDLHLCSLL